MTSDWSTSYGVKIKLQRRKGEGFILKNLRKSTFCGTGSAVGCDGIQCTGSRKLEGRLCCSQHLWRADCEYSLEFLRSVQMQMILAIDDLDMVVGVLVQVEAYHCGNAVG